MNRVFYLLPALLLGIICSCSDHDDIQPETTSLTLNLTAAFGHDVENTRKNAMAFDVEKEDGYVGRIKSVDINVEQTDWKTIFFLRKKGAPSTLYNFEATWSVTQGADRYIDMRIVNKPVTINGVSGNLPDGSYELMAVGGGGKLKDGKVSFAYDEDIEKGYVGENNNKIRVPYTSKWTDVTVKNGNIVGSLDMEVQGVLMCINIGNYITQKIPIENLTITTTNISPDGYFDPTKEDDNGYPKWERYKIEGTTDSYHTVFTHRVGQTLPEAPGNNERAGETIYTYFWGMPVEGHEIITTRTNDVGNMTSSLRISADDYKVKRFNQKIDEANASNTFSYISARDGFKLVSGTFVRVEMDVLRFKTPLEYVAGYNVSPRPRELCTVNSSFTSGYYCHDAVIGNEMFFLPDGYHVPTTEEWHSIITANQSRVVTFDSEGDNNQDEQIMLNGVKNKFGSNFKRKKVNDNIIVYALRFKPTNGSEQGEYPAMKTYNKLTAFRYELIQRDKDYDPNPNGYTLKITSRYLGEKNKNVTIDDVADEYFWRNNINDKTIELPLCGASNRDINNILLAGENPVSLVIGISAIFNASLYMCNGRDPQGAHGWLSFFIETASGTSVSTFENARKYMTIRPFFTSLE